MVNGPRSVFYEKAGQLLVPPVVPTIASISPV